MTHDEMVEVILAHKAGKNIQCRGHQGEWVDTDDPIWDFHGWNYRVAPEDSVMLLKVNKYGTVVAPTSTKNNLKLTFDSETGELKSAEVMK